MKMTMVNSGLKGLINTYVVPCCPGLPRTPPACCRRWERRPNRMWFGSVAPWDLKTTQFNTWDLKTTLFNRCAADSFVSIFHSFKCVSNSIFKLRKKYTYLWKYTYCIDTSNELLYELFVCIFHSFEAGNADVISSFKWRTNKKINEK